MEKTEEESESQDIIQSKVLRRVLLKLFPMKIYCVYIWHSVSLGICCRTVYLVLVYQRRQRQKSCELTHRRNLCPCRPQTYRLWEGGRLASAPRKVSSTAQQFSARVGDRFPFNAINVTKWNVGA